MNNYEYIVASLPVVSKDWKSESTDFDSAIEEISEQLSTADRNHLGILLDGYAGKLDEEFYQRAAGCGNAFIRDFFHFDMNVRNAKVDYLNAALGRPEGTDRMESGDEEFEAREEVDSVLSRKDLIEREKGLDDLMWDKAEELAGPDIFSIGFILSVVVKMKIVDRWIKLNPETGKEYLRTLISGIRSTFDKINYQS